MTLQDFGRQAPADEIGARIASLAPWFHNLHLPSGHQTAPDHPLGDFPSFKWEHISRELPEDMTGMTVLDVGCNAGFYSFRLAARGAKVTALDMDSHYLAQARWAAQQLDPAGRIEFRQMHLYELARFEDQYDVILFLGVLYHLRYPLLALDLLAERLKGKLILQTLTAPADGPATLPGDLDIEDRSQLLRPGSPRAVFIEHKLAGDPTNWWLADDACVRAMARSAGLAVTSVPADETYICERAPAGEHDSIRVVELTAATQASVNGNGPVEIAAEMVPPAARWERSPRNESGDGLEVARSVMPAHLIDDALRLLHLDLLERGAAVQEFSDWLWGAHWFPHLREHETLLALARALPGQWQTGVLCEPQILLQFPHVGPEPKISFHVDQEPAWARDRKYLRITGIPLSPWRRDNGTLLVDLDGSVSPVELDPGDAVMMTRGLPHSGGLNYTGNIRYGVYFRWLEPAPMDLCAPATGRSAS